MRRNATICCALLQAYRALFFRVWRLTFGPRVGVRKLTSRPLHRRRWAINRHGQKEVALSRPPRHQYPSIGRPSRHPPTKDFTRSLTLRAKNRPRVPHGRGRFSGEILGPPITPQLAVGPGSRVILIPGSRSARCQASRLPPRRRGPRSTGASQVPRWRFLGEAAKGRVEVEQVIGRGIPRIGDQSSRSSPARAGPPPLPALLGPLAAGEPVLLPDRAGSHPEPRRRMLPPGRQQTTSAEM